ncbi:MAG: hypothetical protein H6624_07135 [Bdellovibrionaceae bacterium]|nr:hypothetical protein [Bdellovibrionales bacterium]MCB9084101.1 hypothetical protein [Pseudobdellovibrionaceae bacterium]
MANIIIIEDDTKVANQIRSYFKELDENHRLRFFATSEDFQNVYLKGDDRETGYHPLFRSYNAVQMDWLIKQSLQPKSPFSEPAAKVQLNSSAKPTAFDNETTQAGHAFSLTMDQLKELTSIKDLLPEPFHAVWESFQMNLKPAKVISTALPFTNPNGDVWLLKISGQRNTKGGIDIVLRHQPDVFEPIMETERKIAAAKIAQEVKSEDEPDELQLLSTIDLLIFKIGNVQGSPMEWLTKTAAAMKKLGYHPPDFRTRFVATIYEDQNVNKLDLIHSQLDDLIYLPMDRLIFLQKMEIILGLPAMTRPSFLFMQEQKTPIEISKITNIERISEVGMAIRNPVPLNPGVISRFKFRVPTSPDTIITLARSHYSTNHPDLPDQQLVHFHFFGMDREDKKRIFGFAKKAEGHRGLKDEDDGNFEFSADNLFLTAREKEIKHVIVLDADPDSADSTAGLLREGINQINVVTENSYYLFLRNYLGQVDDPPEGSENEGAGSTDAKSDDPSEIRLATPHDLLGDSVSWVISASSQNLVEPVTEFEEGDLILGHAAGELLDQNLNWRRLFKGLDNENLLDETLKLVLSTEKTYKRKFALTDSTDRQKWVQVGFGLHDQDEQILIELSTLEDVAWMKGQDTKLERLDLLVVSEDLVPENVDSWLEGLRGLAEKNDLIGAGEELKVVVMADNVTKKRLQTYRHSKISGLHLKPHNVRALLFECSNHLQAPFTKHNFENQQWLTPKIHAHMTKEVTLEGLSEFGSTLQSPAEIQPGTVLFLHEDIFDNAPNQCLAARFYHSEEVQGQKGIFTCAFIYYGITDAFLKFCRSWIKNNYAAKKSKES